MSITAPDPAYSIPACDVGEMSRLKDKARQEVWAWLPLMEQIHHAKHGTQGELIRRIAQGKKLTASAVRKKYDNWLRVGWRALYSKSKHKSACVLPVEFVEWWREFMRPFQRKKSTCKAAFRKLVHRLELWEQDGGGPDSRHAIGGYDRCPERQRSTQLPMGWSETNLTRLKASKAERAMECQGPKAYADFVPGIMSTRVGFKVGELVFFDDQEADLKVNFPGKNIKATRPLGFAALDWVSGQRIMTGWKPTLLRMDGTREKLNERDFYWFVLGYLTLHGWRSDTGTLLAMEMGTASVKDWFREAVGKVTGGKVRMEHSGRFGDPAFKGMLYEGKSCGNFRFKAALESAFNLERNEMQFLPWQQGRNRDLAPEENHGLDRYNTYLLKALRDLPPEQQAALVMPCLEWSQFLAIFENVQHRINQRTNHGLLDFTEMGFTVQELWMPGMLKGVPLTLDYLRQMDPEQRQALDALAGTDAIRCRLMSPHEVWTAGSKGMTRLQGHHLPILMPEEYALRLRVDDEFLLRHEDPELEPGPMIYLAGKVVNNHGEEIRLKRGTVYRCYLNPFARKTLQVCHEDGRWIGEAPRWDRINRLDPDALTQQMILAKDAVAAERADMKRRAEATGLKRTADYRWNKEVISGRVKTPGRAETEAAQERMEEAAEELRGGGGVVERMMDFAGAGSAPEPGNCHPLLSEGTAEDPAEEDNASSGAICGQEMGPDTAGEPSAPAETGQRGRRPASQGAGMGMTTRAQAQALRSREEEEADVEENFAAALREHRAMRGGVAAVTAGVSGDEAGEYFD